MDTLHDRFKGEMINPWIRKLKEEGEKALLGATETSLIAAKELITSALLERKDRCKRELDDKAKAKLVGKERVEHLMVVLCGYKHQVPDPGTGPGGYRVRHPVSITGSGTRLITGSEPR